MSHFAIEDDDRTLYVTDLLVAPDMVADIQEAIGGDLTEGEVLAVLTAAVRVIRRIESAAALT